MHRSPLVLACLSLTLLASCAATPARHAVPASLVIEVPAVVHAAGETRWWYRSAPRAPLSMGAMLGGEET